MAIGWSGNKNIIECERYTMKLLENRKNRKNSGQIHFIIRDFSLRLS